MENTILLHSCPLCESLRIGYEFVVHINPVYKCNDCDHLFVNPKPKKDTFVDEIIKVNHNHYLSFIDSKLEKISNNAISILEIGDSIFTNETYNITKINCADTGTYLNNKNENTIKYDACVINGIFDFCSHPKILLEKVHSELRDGGLLLFYLPVTDSVSAKKQKLRWSAFFSMRAHFYSTSTVQNILCKYGFGEIEISYADDNGVFVKCISKPINTEFTISIIIPVFNEEKTVLEVLNRVVNKILSGVKKEIIIIESNSTDSTRGIIQDFVKIHPEIKLILEEKPHGKGHAVRKGFLAATGDFIAIQDGDLEYDINDYDQLVAPLICFQKAFVLGSRHTGDWKMRDFGDQSKIKEIIMNLGQIIFTGLINWGCNTKLKDPFTMYKLFRRECLYGLTFDGNRFELDWEIVIKFIRKGYLPIEIPVNYKSRSFVEGKKISIIKDSFIWIKSFIKYRFLYKMN